MAEQMLARGRVSFFFLFLCPIVCVVFTFFSLLMLENAAF